MSAAKISIVIPTLSEHRYIGGLLDSLTQQELRITSEILVVDASPDHRTVEVASQFADRLALRFLYSDRADVAHQRNLGARAARGEYLLFVDADVRLGNPQTISTAIERLAPNDLAVVSVRHR